MKSFILVIVAKTGKHGLNMKTGDDWRLFGRKYEIIVCFAVHGAEHRCELAQKRPSCDVKSSRIRVFYWIGIWTDCVLHWLITTIYFFQVLWQFRKTLFICDLPQKTFAARLLRARTFHLRFERGFCFQNFLTVEIQNTFVKNKDHN